MKIFTCRYYSMDNFCELNKYRMTLKGDNEESVKIEYLRILRLKHKNTDFDFYFAELQETPAVFGDYNVQYKLNGEILFKKRYTGMTRGEAISASKIDVPTSITGIPGVIFTVWCNRIGLKKKKNKEDKKNTENLENNKSNVKKIKSKSAIAAEYYQKNKDRIKKRQSEYKKMIKQNSKKIR